jgi:hypothetical protein
MIRVKAFVMGALLAQMVASSADEALIDIEVSNNLVLEGGIQPECSGAVVKPSSSDVPKSLLVTESMQCPEVESDPLQVKENSLVDQYCECLYDQRVLTDQSSEY